MNEFSNSDDIQKTDGISDFDELATSDKSLSSNELLACDESPNCEGFSISGENEYNMTDPKRKKLRIVTSSLIIISLLIFTSITLWFLGVFNGDFNKAVKTNVGFVGSEIVAANLPTIASDTYTKTVPNKFVGASLCAGVDYYLSEDASFDSAKSQISAAIKYLSSNGYNTVYANVNYNGGVIFDCDYIENTTGGDLLTFINQTAHENGMIVVTAVDVGALAKTNITTADDISFIENILSSDCLINNSDAVLLNGYYLTPADITYNDYLANCGGIGYAQYCQDKLTSVIKQFSTVISKANSSLYIGLLCDPVWATADKESGGIDFANGFSALTDGDANTLGWLKNGVFDFAVVNDNYSTVTDSDPFSKVANWWCESVADSADVSFMLSSSLANSGADGWKSPDQLAKQLMLLSNLDTQGIVFDNYSALYGDTSGSTNAVNEYLLGDITNDYVLKDLSLTTPAKTVYTTNEPYATFIGATDPQFEATLNGTPLERNELGYFSFTLDLKIGVNKFSFVHKGKTVAYSITYQKVIIKSVSPTTNLSLDGGMPFGVTVVAFADSNVTATLNGEDITLSEKKDLDESGVQISEYSSYSGIFYLPAGKTSVQKLGTVTFKIVSSFGTESRTGGSVTINKVDVLDYSAITGPTGGKYIDVGTSLIAEITKNQAEVFSGITTDDWSRPTINYLPAGTVDYTHRSVVYDSSSGNSYRLLRCNRRVYSDNKGASDVSVYEGTLPDVNNITCVTTEESARYTTINLDVDWKAPFLFELNPQNYTNPSTQDYRVSSATFNYIDITFCYAASFNGEVQIAADNPLFSKAEVIKNTADLTLRLYLKKAGAFYGWSAEYNSDGQLVFSFLHPAKISAANNSFGVSLSGVKIHIDAGHGGSDPGAPGIIYSESVLTLTLAQKLQTRLESLGATTFMTRTGNDYVGNEERMNMVRSEKPDYTIAIHRNSSTTSSPNGFAAYHFASFSYNPTKFIYNDFSSAANLFSPSGWSGIKWHYYYLGRVTVCPVVLIECGYMSNTTDYSHIIDDDFNNRSADALTQGIVDYFKSIQ